MQKLPRSALTISILALLSFATLGAALNPASTAAPLSERAAAESVGGAAWTEFLTGVSCGLGVGLLIGGYASGVGIAGAALLTVGIARQCSAAFGF